MSNFIITCQYCGFNHLPDKMVKLCQSCGAQTYLKTVKTKRLDIYNQKDHPINERSKEIKVEIEEENKELDFFDLLARGSWEGAD